MCIYIHICIYIYIYTHTYILDCKSMSICIMQSIPAGPLRA